MITLVLLLAICSFTHSAPSIINAANNATGLDASEFWRMHQQLLDEEHQMLFGSDVILTENEIEANNILMSAKNKEFDNYVENLNYPPARHFFNSKKDIEASQIYQIIKRIPKGALLHTHDSTVASLNFVIQELTYWPDLYMCYTDNDELKFNFFNEPNNECEWELVSDKRSAAENDQIFDAEIRQRLSLWTDDPQSEYDSINTVWTAFEQKLITLSGIINYTEAFKKYLYRGFLEFMNDGISYIEFRGTLPLLYEKDGRVLNSIETFTIYDEVIKQFNQDHQHKFAGVKFIYAPIRRVSNESMWEIVDLARQLYHQFPDTVAGFDLVGQEDLGLPLKDYADQLLNLTNDNIPVFFHAGETAWEGITTDENLIDAIILNTKRIGHGYAISKHPKIKQMALEKDIPLEICPISNQVLKLIDDLRNHPAASLMSEGFPIVISSDDPGTWESDPLSHDFYEAFMAFGGKKADLRFLKKLALNSIKYSSLSEDGRAALYDMWSDQWDNFITSINAFGHLNTDIVC